MTFEEYQNKAQETAIYPEEHSVIYPCLGLSGETGEVLEKIKKIIRKGGDVSNISDEDKTEIKKELGDVLWYLSALSRDLDLSLDDIAKTNIEKLFSRKERGVLHKKGDNR